MNLYDIVPKLHAIKGRLGLILGDEVLTAEDKEPTTFYSLPIFLTILMGFDLKGLFSLLNLTVLYN